MGKLMAFEETQRHIAEEDLLYSNASTTEVKKEKQEKSKSLAFKDILDANEESSEDEDGDHEIVLMTRNFNKYLKFTKRKTGSPFGQKKAFKDKKDDTVPRCFRCQSKKNLKAGLSFAQARDQGKEKKWLRTTIMKPTMLLGETTMLR